MNKKDLINLIKDKANQVEIKEQSTEILARVNLDAIKVEPKPKRFTFEPRLIFSSMLAVILIITFTLVLLRPENEIINQGPNLESMEDVLIFSTISTTTLLEHDYATNTSNNLIDVPAYFEMNSTVKIDRQLNRLTKYFEMMEQLFASPKDFNKEDEVGQGQFGRLMRFKSRDFAGRDILYNLDFNQTEIDESNQYQLMGTITVGTNSFLFTGEGQSDTENTLNIRTQRNTENFVDTTYTYQDNKHHFHIQITKDEVLIDEVVLIIEDDEDQKIVEITFLNDNIEATYVFELSVESNNRNLRITYELNNGTTETGVMVVRVVGRQGFYNYVVQVRPDNERPYIIIKLRNLFNNNR
jgi:hypothetical protein